MKAKLLSAIAVAAVAGCAGGHGSEKVHWSYSGETGPEHWGDLSPEYAIAKTGRRQSPIDLSDVVVSEPKDIEFHYEIQSAELINTGHSFEIQLEKGASVVLDETRYDLIQFHYHSPSEHTINHKHADLEAHFVCRNNRGELAVVAVMYVEGKHNTALDAIWDRLPNTPGERVVVPDVFARAAQALPVSERHYRYDGSLTTPPCTEGVTWIVMQESVEVSREQIDRYRSWYAGTNRPVQPLHERTVISE